MQAHYTQKARAAALKAWAGELGGDEELRRLLRIKATVLGDALAARRLTAEDAARIDAALEQREELGPRHYSRLLRALRSHAGIRSRDVAVGADLTATRITEYEVGRVTPDLATALALWRFWVDRYPALRFEHLFGELLTVEQLATLVSAQPSAS